MIMFEFGFAAILWHCQPTVCTMSQMIEASGMMCQMMIILVSGTMLCPSNNASHGRHLYGMSHGYCCCPGYDESNGRCLWICQMVIGLGRLYG